MKRQYLDIIKTLAYTKYLSISLKNHVKIIYNIGLRVTQGALSGLQESKKQDIKLIDVSDSLIKFKLPQEKLEYASSVEFIYLTEFFKKNNLYSYKQDNIKETYDIKNEILRYYLLILVVSIPSAYLFLTV